MTKSLIVTADDFGASTAINEAIERGHRDGCLTAASLMVTGEAVDDAIGRARAMPTLGVGLHLVLVEGMPALPASDVPDLVDDTGRFRTDMARMGADIFFRPAVRRQLFAEITAQFSAFAATGLPLDHVNAHKHFHLHPTIAGAVLEIGRRHGMRAMRAPVEPIAVLRQLEPVSDTALNRVATLWAQRLRRRLRLSGVTVPDQVFGLAWSGAMTADRVAGLIDRSPDGVTELYLHPAMRDDFPGHAPGYQYAAECAALCDPAVRAAIARSATTLARFSDL